MKTIEEYEKEIAELKRTFEHDWDLARYYIGELEKQIKAQKEEILKKIDEWYNEIKKSDEECGEINFLMVREEYVKQQFEEDFGKLKNSIQSPEKDKPTEQRTKPKDNSEKTDLNSLNVQVSKDKTAPKVLDEVCETCGEERYKHNDDGTCSLGFMGLLAHTGHYKFKPKKKVCGEIYEDEETYYHCGDIGFDDEILLCPKCEKEGERK